MKKESLILIVTVIATMTLTAWVGNDNTTKVPGTLTEVKIGEQTWMAANLNVESFRNGDPIPEVKSAEEWEKTGKRKKPAWCYYDYASANGTKYGKLYNWYAVTDPRGLAPDGWHVPDSLEWTQLSNFLGGLKGSCTKLKSSSGWKENGNGTNESGFNGQPAGYNPYNGNCSESGETSRIWMSKEHSKSNAWFCQLEGNKSDVFYYQYYKVQGLSVRCVKD
ncbi:MAG: fibrobacter succinogenes major paralogous domain-containing protein [Bacteroidota bacterium]